LQFFHVMEELQGTSVSGWHLDMADAGMTATLSGTDTEGTFQLQLTRVSR
jgi:hypothetical protein